MYHRLTEFRRQEGHFFVPRRHPDPELRALGRWAGEQRIANNKDELHPYRFELLASAGFPFDYHAERWESLFSQLRRFRKRYGDCHVPFKDQRWGSLAGWVQVQRRNYRGQQLSRDRIDRLDALGFAWSLQRGRQTPAKILRERPSVFLLRLEAFKEEFGHVRVPANYSADETLPRLCRLAARLGRSGGLSAEAIELLESWGFDFMAYLETTQTRLSSDRFEAIGGWEQFLQALINYKNEHNHLEMPRQPPPEIATLARACALTRRLYLAEDPFMTPARVERLRAIGFSFESPRPYQAAADPDHIL